MRVRHTICYMLLLGYLLGIHNGRIALWREDDPEPVYVFPYNTVSLPPEDIQLLRRGVRAENAVELTKLLENYLS